MNNEHYIDIKKVAEAKGLSSTRSLRLEINKLESKYVSREIKVNGGTSYEILFASLDPETQAKIREDETQSTALVPKTYKFPAESFVSDKARLVSCARLDIVKAALKLRKQRNTQKEADADFLDLYNSGLYMPKTYRFLGSISIGTLHRWIRTYQRHGTAESLIPQHKCSKQGEYNSILDSEMKRILLCFLLNQNQFNFGKAKFNLFLFYTKR